MKKINHRRQRNIARCRFRQRVRAVAKAVLAARARHAFVAATKVRAALEMAGKHVAPQAPVYLMRQSRAPANVSTVNGTVVRRPAVRASEVPSGSIQPVPCAVRATRHNKWLFAPIEVYRGKDLRFERDEARRQKKHRKYWRASTSAARA